MASPSSPGIITVKSVDASGNNPVVQTDSWASTQKSVVTPGAAVQCPSLEAPAGMGIVFLAKPGNTGEIYLGNSKANAENAAVRVELGASNAVILKVSNANLVWVDAETANEGICIFVEQS